METKLGNLYYNQSPNILVYKSSGSGGKLNIPTRTSRRSHGEFLDGKFKQAWDAAEEKQQQIGAVSFATRHGVYLEIKGQEGYELLTKSLEDARQRVRVCNIKTEGDEEESRIISSTVFIPNDKRDFFIKKINRYKETDKKEKVIGTIEMINLAMVDALWMSGRSEIPDTVPKWCEVWLMYEPKEETEEVVKEFHKICGEKNIEYKEQKIIFPERIVLGVYANKQQLSELQWLSSRVAEFRIMTTPTGFYDSLSESEQREFIKEFLERLDMTTQSNTSVCLLDTGVNNGHDLLSLLLTDENMHAVDPNKGVHDNADHGTKMAGIASYFTLEEKMEGTAPIVVHHFLESVKLFDKSNDNPQELYGYITEDAGWWKLRTNLKKYNSKIRYSLIASIEAPESEVDLYTVIKSKIEAEVSIPNRTAVATEINAL